MTIKTNTKSHAYVVEYLKDLPFFNKHIEKPESKPLKTLICLLSFLFINN